MNQPRPWTTLEVSDDLPENRLFYRNTPELPRLFKYDPASLSLVIKAVHLPSAADRPYKLVVSAGSRRWLERPVTAGDLQHGFSLVIKIPAGPLPPGSHSLDLALYRLPSEQKIAAAAHPVQVIWEGHSGFDPAVHGYNFTNNSTAYGDVTLDRTIFERTYGLVFWPARFFRKMYRDILGATADEKGLIPGAQPLSSGLCTGMIRSALALYQAQAEPPACHRRPEGDTLNLIKLYHGRQLTDRALTRAARWIVLGGPRRVFNAFKAEVLGGNQDPLAFDIGVAAWGRRDFWRAIQAEGHTVVPYAFRQSEPAAGEIFIYNPNDPPLQHDYGYANVPGGQLGRLAGPVIYFDLARNTYYYNDHYQSRRSDGRTTTIVAVPQSAYRRGRMALLASLANRFI